MTEKTTPSGKIQGIIVLVLILGLVGFVVWNKLKGNDVTPPAQQSPSTRTSPTQQAPPLVPANQDQSPVRPLSTLPSNPAADEEKARAEQERQTQEEQKRLGQERDAQERARREEEQQAQEKTQPEDKRTYTGTATDIRLLEHQCFEAVNRERASRGIPLLKLSDSLVIVARHYSARMAKESFFASKDPDGQTVQDRVNAAGLKWRSLGQCLAYSNGYSDPVAKAIKGWMEDKGTRQNIVDQSFQQLAIGVQIGADGTTYFTAIFLKPS